MLFALLGAHAVLAAAAPMLARRIGRAIFVVCALAPAATVAWVMGRSPAVPAVTERITWAPTLGLDVELRLDAFATVMVLLVSGVGALVFLYAHGYFDKPRHDIGKFAGLLTAFAGSMLGLVLADNLLLLFVFWELTSVTSYLLIGFEDRKAEAREAALQALLTTGAGGLALLGGIVILGQLAGTYSLSGVIEAAPALLDGGQTALVSVGLVLCLVGAFTKSAQLPFHTWLPAAMAAPTPVSAYLHAAAMVKAGVYLVARLAPAFAAAPVWRPLVITVGVTTMLVGGYRALRQHDLKLLLAFGTVSQLGLLVALFGSGSPKATFAGVALLLAHAVFKGALFMITGIVDHVAHSRDIRRLTGLHAVMPAVFIAAVVTAASMAGLPPLLGFISKEAAFEAFVGAGGDVGGVLALAGVVVGSILTVAYSARFLWGAFATKKPAQDAQTAVEAPLIRPESAHAPSRTFAAPALLLSLLTVVFGLWPTPLDPLVNRAAVVLDPAWIPETLRLWHGFNAALGLSALVVAVGAILFAANRTVERYQALVPAVPGPQQAYQACVRGLVGGARRMTGVVQNGSLPIYLGVITLTFLLLPGRALLGAWVLPDEPALAANPIQAVVAVVVVLAALAVGQARRRFSAVLFLGAVGYGVAVLFMIHGAPDLALTQLLIETLTLVVFVLVLRHLPDRFEAVQLRVYRILRGALSVGVGAFVFAFALIAANARTVPPISGEYLARALPEADGRNVVNVVLVDFRALDTLGEIVVLVVAAVGITSLVVAARIHGRRSSGR